MSGMYNRFAEVGERKVDVLIVEDEPTARRALRTLVASRGYHADAVSSGEDALRHVSEGKRPQVILVDLHLPGINGIELIQRLMSISPLTVPVLITAAAPEVVDEIPNTVPLTYFQKPVDFDELMTVLHSADH